MWHVLPWQAKTITDFVKTGLHHLQPPDEINLPRAIDLNPANLRLEKTQDPSIENHIAEGPFLKAFAPSRQLSACLWRRFCGNSPFNRREVIRNQAGPWVSSKDELIVVKNRRTFRLDVGVQIPVVC